MEELKWPTTAEEIKRVLDAAEIDYDPELGRSSLWKLYKETAQKMQDEDPDPSAEQDFDLDIDEPAIEAPVEEAPLPEPPAEETPDETPAKQADEPTGEEITDSQTDSVPSSKSLTAEQLKDVVTVLEELGAFKLPPLLKKFAKTGSREGVDTKQLEYLAVQHARLRNTLRYQPTHHGVIICAFDALSAAFYKQGAEAKKQYDYMLMLLIEKFNTKSVEVRNRMRKYQAPAWAVLAMNNED